MSRAKASYVYGNTARKRVQPQKKARAPFRVVNGGRQTEKPSRKITAMNLLFMAFALVVTALALYHYVDVQTSLEATVTSISRLEKELTTLRRENDEAYSRANAKVDLEEVKRVAIQELGMKYADEGQIVVYSDEGAADYVRQVADIPEAVKAK